MSTMKDEAALAEALAQGLRAERDARGWSLAELAERSGVSRAMISKVERGEASPTAALLGRLVAAFGMTLSTLLAKVEGTAPGSRLRRRPDQPCWRDPATGYLRRAVTIPGAEPEIVEVLLPAGKRVDYPAATYAGRAHALLVLEGQLLFHEGTLRHGLGAGDSLVLGAPADCAYENASGASCRYLVVLSRR
ncbi:helix-turn-helix domain-containing protein [Roseomonas elaeocarpi]|uniref:Helix-turn-helix domain-containing protein n=1 Tax=Roseomonas elaeocarpi TaxID=907779 RepID=A0ABV6JVT8_9PROT